MKHLSSILFAINLLVAQLAYSQCTPDASYVGAPAGIYPGISVNLPPVTVPEAYSTSLTINTETDTTISVNVGGTPTNAIAYIGAMRVNAVNGLPTGFTWTANQTEWNNGGSAPNFTPVQGCISILADASAVQSLMQANPFGISFPLEIIIDAKISSTNNALFNFVVSNSWLSDLSATVPEATPQVITGYVLTILPSTPALCSPNASFYGSASGVYPGTDVNLPAIVQSVDYSAALTINSLTDTSLIINNTSITAYIDAVRINSITGLPQGFMWSANQPEWTNSGSAPNFTQAQGCILISADGQAVQQLIQNNPTGASFPIEIVMDARISSTDNAFANLLVSNQWTSELSGLGAAITPVTITGYVLILEPTITGLNYSISDNQKLYPNPTNGLLTIASKGSSANHPSTFTLFNYAGQEVFRKTISQETETISLPEILNSGIYLVRVVDSMGDHTVTELLVVAR